MQPGEVGEHGEVGREEEERGNRPREPRLRVERDGRGEGGEAFEPQQHACAAGSETLRGRTRHASIDRRTGCQHRSLLGNGERAVG
jgi:hypothetical protein